MRIAVSYENENVFQHFGHTEQFKIYDVDNNNIVKEELVATNGQGHGALAVFLHEASVDVLICGGIGDGAKNALSSQGIRIYGGVSGNADEAIKALINGTLKYNPNIKCEHHSHEEGHTCGDHGCGKEHSHLERKL